MAVLISRRMASSVQCCYLKFGRRNDIDLDEIGAPDLRHSSCTCGNRGRSTTDSITVRTTWSSLGGVISKISFSAWRTVLIEP